MLKFSIDNYGAGIHAEGNVATLCSDMVYALRTLYEQMLEHNKDDAERFRELMEDDLIRLAFADDISEVTKERLREIRKDTANTMANKEAFMGPLKAIDGALDALSAAMEKDSDEK